MILPIGYEVISQQTVLPGQILAVQVHIRGAKVRIVTVYLHPETVQDNLKTLLKYLQTIDLREWTFLLGDFNRADQHCPEQWQSLLEEYGFTDGRPALATFRAPGCETNLDRILLGRAHVDNLKVFGSPSWLFVILLAGRAAAHHKTSTGKERHLRDHTRASLAGQGVCARTTSAGVSVASGHLAPRCTSR